MRQDGTHRWKPLAAALGYPMQIRTQMKWCGKRELEPGPATEKGEPAQYQLFHLIPMPFPEGHIRREITSFLCTPGWQAGYVTRVTLKLTSLALDRGKPITVLEHRGDHSPMSCVLSAAQSICGQPPYWRNNQ